MMGHKKTPAPLSPLDNSIYEYLKNNHQSFDIEAFLHRYEEHGPVMINTTFKNVVDRIASFKRETKFKQWARMIKKSKYAILDSIKAHLFWAHNARLKSQLRHEQKSVNDLLVTTQSSSLSARSSSSKQPSERLQESGNDEWKTPLEASYSILNTKENRKTKDTFESEYLRMLPEIAEQDKWKVLSEEDDVIDMTKVLNAYRKHSFDENAKPDKNMKPVRALSLDCVYLFSIDGFSSPFTSKSVRLALNRQDQYECLPDTASLWGKEVLQVLQDQEKNTWDVEDVLLSVKLRAAKTKNEFARIYARVLYDMASTLSVTKAVHENTLVHLHLHSPLHWIFGTDKRFGLNWATASLQLCKGRSTGSMQPDFVAFTEVAGRRFDLFVVEVKKPQQPKGQDLVKVGFMLRQMLTKLVEEKIERPQVYALIVDGYECATYKMVIDHQFIFKLVEMNQFLLPDRVHKLPCLETTVASLYQMKKLAVQVRMGIIKRYDEMKAKVPPTGYVPLRYLPPLSTVQNTSNEAQARVKRIAKRERGANDEVAPIRRKRRS